MAASINGAFKPMNPFPEPSNYRMSSKSFGSFDTVIIGTVGPRPWNMFTASLRCLRKLPTLNDCCHSIGDMGR